MSVELFQGIPGLDVEDGLQHCGGREALYEKLLGKFVTEYADSAIQIDRLLARDAQEDAQRLAHTMKGVAGNLGATQLFVVSDSLCCSIKEAAPDSMEKLEEFRSVLVPLIQALNAVLKRS